MRGMIDVYDLVWVQVMDDILITAALSGCELMDLDGLSNVWGNVDDEFGAHVMGELDV
jgi:hypothetical protein